MKHLRLFETETQFETVKTDIPKPWFAFTRDDSTVHCSSENTKVNNNGFEYVDLGLPSGNLWATCNVGAASPGEYGKYFAWGNTDGYYRDEEHDFNWETSITNSGASNPSVFNSLYWNRIRNTVCPDNVLALEYDAAHFNMGGDWHMPTKEQFEELIENTTSEWITNYQNSGVDGRLLTSMSNGNVLFIISGGSNSTGWGATTITHLWSSTNNDTVGNSAFGFGSNATTDPKILNHQYYVGKPVRGVISSN